MATKESPLVGVRLATPRKLRKLTQSDVARVLGLKSHQIVSNIENGTRPMKGAEMMALIDNYGITPKYLTDPFRLAGEGKFCWRKSQCSTEALAAYQGPAGTWLASYRALSRPRAVRAPMLVLWSIPRKGFQALPVNSLNLMLFSSIVTRIRVAGISISHTSSSTFCRETRCRRTRLRT